MPLLSVTQQEAVQIRDAIRPPRRGGVRTAVPGGYWPREFIIASASPLEGFTNRWLYVLQECRFDPLTLESVVLEGGLTINATNAWEDGNGATIVAPGILVADLPDTWEILPASYGLDDERITMVVQAWYHYTTSEGEIRFRFSAPFTITGRCPEASTS